MENASKKKPKDYVISTGKTHSIKEFINIATKYLNMNVRWIGLVFEKLINKDNNKIIIQINPKF